MSRIAFKSGSQKSQGSQVTMNDAQEQACTFASSDHVHDTVSWSRSGRALRGCVINLDITKTIVKLAPKPYRICLAVPR